MPLWDDMIRQLLFYYSILFFSFYYFFFSYLSLSVFHVKVFLPGGQSTANMALLLVQIQDFAHLCGKGWADGGEAFGDVFMYRTLTDPELFRRIPHRCSILNNIIRYPKYTLFYVIFQGISPEMLFLQCMRVLETV